MTKTAYIIYGKYPEPYNVKTRLGKTIGYEKAANFYRKCAENIFSEVKSKKNADIFFSFPDLKNKEKIAEWIPDNFILLPQQGNDLGEKMYNSFSSVYKTKYKKILLFGSDISELTNDIFTICVKKLDVYDVVIIPTYDGGYCLIGLKEAHEKIFQNIEWSTPSVFNRTIDNIETLNLTYYVLPKVHDIDTYNDYIQLS